MEYLDTLNEEVKQYFKILSPEFQEWLLEYIDTPEMQRIKGTSMSCGTDYSKLFNFTYWYSNLEHSVGVALIIWHFTHYIIPLTKYNNTVCRINEISKQAENDINEYFNIKHYKYTGFEFDFKPYENR